MLACLGIDHLREGATEDTLSANLAAKVLVHALPANMRVGRYHERRGARAKLMARRELEKLDIAYVDASPSLKERGSAL